MLRSKTIKLEAILQAKRFDCRYFFNVMETIDNLSNPKYTIKELSDKTITDLVTDGEHQPLNRLAEGKFRYLYGRNIKEGFIIDIRISNAI